MDFMGAVVSKLATEHVKGPKTNAFNICAQKFTAKASPCCVQSIIKQRILCSAHSRMLDVTRRWDRELPRLGDVASITNEQLLAEGLTHDCLIPGESPDVGVLRQTQLLPDCRQEFRQTEGSFPIRQTEQALLHLVLCHLIRIWCYIVVLMLDIACLFCLVCCMFSVAQQRPTTRDLCEPDLVSFSIAGGISCSMQFFSDKS